MITKVVTLIALPVIIAFISNGLTLFSLSRSSSSFCLTMINMIASQVTEHLGSAFILAFSQIIWIGMFILVSGTDIASDIGQSASYIFSRYSDRDNWFKKQLSRFVRRTIIYVSCYYSTCFFISLHVASPDKDVLQILYLTLFLISFLFILFLFGFLCNVLSIKFGNAVGCTLTILIVFLCSGISSLASVPRIYQWINPIWIPLQTTAKKVHLDLMIIKLMILVTYCIVLILFTRHHIRLLDLWDKNERGSKT